MPTLFRRLDYFLIATACTLLGVGLLALYSFSETLAGNGYFLRQTIFALIALMAMLFMATLDYRHLARLATPLYFTTLVILALVLFLGVKVRGTVGWLSFGLLQVQPVEFAKLVLILFLASFISKKRSDLGEWTRLIASLVLAAGMMFLVLRQPDLGSSLVLGFIWLSMVIVSGLRWQHVVVLALLGGLVAGGAWFALADYQKARLQTFLNPELDPKGSGYNVIQSMVAVGSGGFSGKGIGQGTQSQLSFLPERHTDFIFAVLAEELGLTGGFLVIGLYGFLLWRIRYIAEQAADNTGYLIGIGILAFFFIQILVNLGMNMGILPVTGLPAPLLSYGGSSLLASFMGLGLLLSVYRFRRENEDSLLQSQPDISKKWLK